jgi:hypothetical protein
MGEILNNREIAMGLWLGGLLTWGATKSWFRTSLGGVVRAFFQRQILTMFSVMVGYIVLVVMTLNHFGLWEARQTKDTIIWAVVVGGASMFRLMSIARDSSFFIETIKDNLKLVVFIEFVVSVFVFSLPIELVIVPLFTFLALLLVFSERDPKHRIVTSILNGIMIVAGAGLLIHAVYKMAADFREFSTLETLADFSLTPVLTICFIPFLFVAARYAHHQNFLIRLSQAIKDARLRRYAYRMAMLRFRFDVSSLDRWSTCLFSRSINNRKDVGQSIDRILAMRRAEKAPRPVSFADGWSPYAAKDFLKSEGFEARYYSSHDDRDWYASSTQQFEGASLNSMEYSVEGMRDVAKKLQLELTVYGEEVPQSEFHRFLKAFKTLYETAMQAELGNQFGALENGEQYWAVGNRSISFHKENWKSGRGSELRWTIEVV